MKSSILSLAAVAAFVGQAFATPTPTVGGRDTTDVGSSAYCITSNIYKIDGDGAPTYPSFDKQVTETINCGSSNSCSVEHEEGESITFGFDGGISADSWISAGFSVSKTYEESNAYTCYGEENEETCIWYNMAYTEYAVQEYITGCGQDPRPIGDVVRIKSPNDNNANGGGYYCVQGSACRNINDGYWA